MENQLAKGKTKTIWLRKYAVDNRQTNLAPSRLIAVDQFELDFRQKEREDSWEWFVGSWKS